MINARLKRIAFLGRGGHTLPTYRALLNKLSKEYELVVYLEVPVQPEWLQLEHRYSIRSVPAIISLHQSAEEIMNMYNRLIKPIKPE